MKHFRNSTVLHWSEWTKIRQIVFLSYDSSVTLKAWEIEIMTFNSVQMSSSNSTLEIRQMFLSLTSLVVLKQKEGDHLTCQFNLPDAEFLSWDHRTMHLYLAVLYPLQIFIERLCTIYASIKRVSVNLWPFILIAKLGSSFLLQSNICGAINCVWSNRCQDYLMPLSWFIRGQVVDITDDKMQWLVNIEFEKFTIISLKCTKLGVVIWSYKLTRWDRQNAMYLYWRGKSRFIQ